MGTTQHVSWSRRLGASSLHGTMGCSATYPRGPPSPPRWRMSLDGVVRPGWTRPVHVHVLLLVLCTLSISISRPTISSPSPHRFAAYTGPGLHSPGICDLTLPAYPRATFRKQGPLLLSSLSLRFHPTLFPASLRPNLRLVLMPIVSRAASSSNPGRNTRLFAHSFAPFVVFFTCSCRSHSAPPSVSRPPVSREKMANCKGNT